MKNKSKNENKNEFSFLFSFCFSFLFLLSKSFCIFVNSTWPRGAIGSQLSLDWPRSVITFLLTPRGLEVPQMVNSLLLGLEVSQHLRLLIFLVAQRFSIIMNYETLTWLTFTCSKLTIETLKKRNMQMLKNNFYTVVVQKWFLNRVIKNRCQLLIDLVVN